MKEQFTKYSRRSLIRMWRTLKAESGCLVCFGYGVPDSGQSLFEAMRRMEKRTEQVDGIPWFRRIFK